MTFQTRVKYRKKVFGVKPEVAVEPFTDYFDSYIEHKANMTLRILCGIYAAYIWYKLYPLIHSGSAKLRSSTSKSFAEVLVFMNIQ